MHVTYYKGSRRVTSEIIDSLAIHINWILRQKSTSVQRKQEILPELVFTFEPIDTATLLFSKMGRFNILEKTQK
jgi:hypothetical protein